MNFAQSRIPALVCSLQSEYGCQQARSYGEQRGNATPHSKVFRLILQRKSTKLPQETYPSLAFRRTQTWSDLLYSYSM